MAWSSLNDAESGFATPAAAAASLAIALMAAAVMTAGVSELRFARADLRRSQADYALAGAQTRAALSVLQAGNSGRLLWSPTGAAEALAEPEAAKLDLAHAVQLDDATLAKFGVSDAGPLRDRLAALGRADAAEIVGADAAPLWRACARSVISPYGSASKLQLATASSPAASTGMQWRIGEVWRIRVVLAGGWVDDRVVRFTGDPNQPAAVVERRMTRGEQEGNRCDALFAAS